LNLPDFFGTGEEVDVARDRTGRPYVLPVSWLAVDGDGSIRREGTREECLAAGGTLVRGPVLHDRVRSTYTRVTTFIDSVGDKAALGKWEKRMILGHLGTERGMEWLSDIVTADGDRVELDRIAAAILDDSGAKDAAGVGTAIHKLTERHDAGLISVGDPCDYPDHLAAWVAVTAHLEMHAIELFVVNDEFRTGGVIDRLVRWPGECCPTCGLDAYVGDLKTGRVDPYTYLKIAMQLALYATSECYDPATGERSPLPIAVCPHRALVVHVPARSDVPMVDSDLWWVDLTKGMEAVRVAAAARALSKVRNVAERIDR
jgi:hypothetical protein